MSGASDFTGAGGFAGAGGACAGTGFGAGVEALARAEAVDEGVDDAFDAAFAAGAGVLLMASPHIGNECPRLEGGIQIAAVFAKVLAEVLAARF